MCMPNYLKRKEVITMPGPSLDTRAGLSAAYLQLNINASYLDQLFERGLIKEFDYSDERLRLFNEMRQAKDDLETINQKIKLL